MDQALWISWYDLPADGRDAYLSWLHSAYIPQLLKKPGILWAAHYKTSDVPPASFLHHIEDPSVPTGNEYIFLAGGETALAFSQGYDVYAKKGPNKLRAGLSPDDLKMLALRKAERTSLFAEVARTTGPAAQQREGQYLAAPCIQLGSYDIRLEDKDEVLAWYAEWRMPCMHSMPGCVGIRILASVSGWAKHGVLYEFASLAERNKYHPTHEDPYPEMKAWSNACVRKLIHGPKSPNVAERIWPPIK